MARAVVLAAALVAALVAGALAQYQAGFAMRDLSPTPEQVRPAPRPALPRGCTARPFAKPAPSPRPSLPSPTAPPAA